MGIDNLLLISAVCLGFLGRESFVCRKKYEFIAVSICFICVFIVYVFGFDL